MKKNYMSSYEIEKFVDSLCNESLLLSEFFRIGIPCFSEEIKRACIKFYPNGGFEMLINPGFWRTLTFYEKKFVLAHEIVHVFFDHGKRMSNMFDKRISNIAADIVVNESLVYSFGFERNLIRFSDFLCWRDTIFNNEHKENPLKSFEQYYYILSSEGYEGDKITLDNHEEEDSSSSFGSDGGKNSEMVAKTIIDIMKNVTQEEVDQIKEEVKSLLSCDQESNSNTEGDQKYLSNGYGNAIGNAVLSYEIKNFYYEYFKTVIDDWVLSRDYKKEEDQFVFKEEGLELMDDDEIMIPSTVDVDEDGKGKNRLWVFLDVSGSCLSFVDDFVRVCMGIPKENFEVRFFSFDVYSREVEVKDNKLILNNVGGGTDFKCIDEIIAKEPLEDKKPHDVFILTDGFAPKIKVESMNPEHWHFFIMTFEGEKITNLFLPDKSKFYNFKAIK